MARIETYFNQDLKKPVKVQYLDGNVFSQDNNGNLVGVYVFDGGEPVQLTGSVSGNIIRSDGATVAVNGSISGNKAYIVIPESAYAVPGVISIIIKLSNESESTATICAVVANVYQSSTDTAVDPGTVIPSISDLIAQINAAISSLPPDYSSLVKDVNEINTVINGKTTYYAVQSQTSWVKSYLTPYITLKKDDYLTVDVTFGSAPASSTYMYLEDGATRLKSQQCQNLSSVQITYKMTADTSNFRIATNSESYTGMVYVALTVSSRQTNVSINHNTATSVAHEKPGFISLQRFSEFRIGGYDYPNFNYNSFQISSGVITAPFDMYMRVSNGFKIIAIFVSGGTSSGNSGWQEHNLYIPKGTQFVLKMEKVSHGSDEQADVVAYLDSLYVYNDNAVTWYSVKDYADEWQHSGYISYATGAKVSAGAYWEIYKFHNPGFKWVKIHSSVSSRDVGEISFYSTDEIDTEGYIQSASQYAGSTDEDHYLYAEVPENCKLMCICSRNRLNNSDPFDIGIFVDNPEQYKNIELLNRSEGLNIFKDFKYIYHFNVNNLSEIPSESLFDIEAAHRLGFKAFELNVHKTATVGKYICMHGTGGKIGNELVARDGTDISNLTFESVTAQTYLEDYIYNTSNDQYKTHVTFLDDALKLCKKYNMIPVVSWADYDAIKYFEEIMGSRYILLIYNNYYIRRANFKGTYMLYQALTAEQLEETLEKAGSPFMYCVTSDQELTDSEYEELATICHEHNSMIGIVGVYQTAAQNEHLLNLGTDYMSSGWDVEYFDNGNKLSLRSNGTFTEFTHTGTVSGEVLSLANNGTISASLSGDTPLIAKGYLAIRYSGTLIFNLGSNINNVSITSDGTKDVILSSAFFRAKPVFSAKASGSVSVYNCVYDASVC